MPIPRSIVVGCINNVVVPTTAAAIVSSLEVSDIAPSGAVLPTVLEKAIVPVPASAVNPKAPFTVPVKVILALLLVSIETAAVDKVVAPPIVKPS